MKRFIVPLLTAVMVVSIIFAGCMPGAPVTPPAAKAPIRIATLTELAGVTYVPQGTNMLAGYHLAAKEFNDAGGVLGRQVECIDIHEGYTSEEVISAYKEAVSIKPNAILCGIEKGTTDAGAYVLRDSGIVSINIYGNAQKLATPGYYARGFKINNYCMQFLQPMKQYVEREGFTRVAVVTLDAGYGYEAADTCKAFWPEGGPVTLTDVLFYQWGGEDVNPEITRAVAGNPDIIFAGIWGEALCGNTMKKLNELNYKGKLAVDCDGLQTEHIAGELKELGEGVLGVYFWMPDQSIPENWEYVEKIQEFAEFTPNGMGAAAYTGMKAILSAMQIAGTADDPDAISRAMYEVDFITPWGIPFWLFPGGQMYEPCNWLGEARSGEILPLIRGPVAKEDYNSPQAWYDAYVQDQYDYK